MTSKNWRKHAYVLAMAGSIQSVILSTVAMFFYTGGTINNPSSPGYSFLENILSDLGRLYAFSGQLNLVSFIIYNISLFLMGALVIPYFLAIPSLFRGLKEAKWFCISGSVVGVFLSLMLIGASVTPSDLVLDIHLMFGIFSFFAGLPLAILFSFAIFLNKKIPNFYGVVYIILGVVLLLFILSMFQDVNAPTLTPRFVIGQKIVVYTMLLCFFFQGYGAKKIEPIPAKKKV